MFSSALTLVRAGLVERGIRDRSELRAQTFVRLYGAELSSAQRERVIKRIRDKGAPLSVAQEERTPEPHAR